MRPRSSLSRISERGKRRRCYGAGGISPPANAGAGTSAGWTAKSLDEANEALPRPRPVELSQTAGTQAEVLQANPGLGRGPRPQLVRSGQPNLRYCTVLLCGSPQEKPPRRWLMGLARAET